MFINFFKRNSAAPAAFVASVAPKPKQIVNVNDVEMRERRKFPRALPVPEVFEGDGGESDWALWSDAIQKLNDGDSAAGEKNSNGSSRGAISFEQHPSST